MASYFYIDPQGCERGPFAYDAMKAWYDAGYLAPTLGCRRNDERAYVRTISRVVVEDGIGGRGGQVGGRERALAEVPPPPPARESARFGVGRSASEIAQCVDRVMDVLDQVLPIVLEGALREEFGEVWSDMLRQPPPWTLETTLRELKANWGSLFSSQPRRVNEIECLLDCAIRMRKGGAGASGEGQAREISAAAVALLSACPTTYPPAVIERLRVAWEEVERIRAFLHGA